MRFLMTRRWMLFALAVALLAVGCVWLGNWQFHRLHDREQTNAWTRRNLAQPPAPVQDVLSVDRALPVSGEWRRVTATGSYDADRTVVVRYQTRDGKSGVDLVTPLVTSAGTAVLVDRGWIPSGNTGTAPADLPAPPAGTVTVVGYVRADATGRGIEVEDGSTRAISSGTIAESLPYRVYAGFVDAQTESPPAGRQLVPAELPDLGEGPHLFYGIQWWFFAALAVFGFAYLAWDERRGGDAAARALRRGRTESPSRV